MQLYAIHNPGQVGLHEAALTDLVVPMPHKTWHNTLLLLL